MEGVSEKIPSLSSARRARLELRRLKSGSGRDAVVKRLRNGNGEEEWGANLVAGRVGPDRIPYGSVSVIGRRREMEDAVAVVLEAAGPGPGYDFFGVYDGHGGSRVAHACRERMHVVLAEEMARMAAASAEVEPRWRWKEAMEASFSRVDWEVGEDVEAEGEVDRTVGSTAVVVVVGGQRIVVANCGDSRAVLSRGGVAVPLSSDHKPDRPDEMERVEAAGGRVINWNGFRVLGVLATSRSIGDYYLKPYVTSEPEVTITERTSSDEFLILASDGLWDVLSNEVACKIARNCLSGRTAKFFPDAVNGCTAADAASLLAELALSRGSRDNISVVVVELGRPRIN
ncbi:probable protein phosphatase 2C 8 [Typha latifolia]|uniref:probable protein phosphatase 2C 8 n=1 Tax=Typha latifolia TaxID=4733 RepID=UPI003C30BF6D